MGDRLILLSLFSSSNNAERIIARGKISLLWERLLITIPLKWKRNTGRWRWG